jgi:hypothetical protein
MPSILDENPISLEAAARVVPPARGGDRCHISTLVRWIRKGALAPNGSRARLEAIRLGGRWLTSRAAIQRFCEALTPRLDTDTAPSRPTRTPRQADRASVQAGERLAEAGA